jgi:hypothetical protein
MIDILRNSLMITGFVFVMMLVIEYVNVITSGGWGERLARNRAGQYLLAAVLGALPGCLGPFAIVAMFSHRIVGLGAVITAMIATSGDETFVMLALIPKQTLMLIPALMATGILAGILTDALSGRIGFLEKVQCHDLVVHEGHEGNYFPRGKIIKQWRSCTPARGILAVVLVLLLVAVISGQFSHHGHGIGDAGGLMTSESIGRIEDDHEHAGHDHEAGDLNNKESADSDYHDMIIPHDHSASDHHDTEPGRSDEDHDDHGGWDWIRITLLVTSILALFIVATVPNHFLEEHLWRHIAIRHLPRIFLWTFGALLVLHLLTANLDLDLGGLMSRGQWFVLLAASLAGLIPQSGPHLIFVTLFAGGYIPVSVLLANSIVQDGHGMLPVLAYSRRVFFLIKAVNLLFGLLVGAAAMAAGI